MTAVTKLDPLSMTLYSGWHVEQALAVYAAQFVATQWETDIAVLVITDQPVPLFGCFDLSERGGEAMRERAVIVCTPEGT